MIINIRGTHGSGKSSIVRTLIDRYPHIWEGTDRKNRPLNYRLSLSNGSTLFVVGSYETACGGCDGIHPYSLIWPRVVEFAKQGHVIFEGSLVSSSYGEIGRSSEVYGDDFVFAFLNTPIEVCIQRITKRRLQKGNTKPLNPGNTISKFNSIQKSIPKIQNEFERRTIMIDYKKPVPQILKLLYGG